MLWMPRAIQEAKRLEKRHEEKKELEAIDKYLFSESDDTDSENDAKDDSAGDNEMNENNSEEK